MELSRVLNGGSPYGSNAIGEQAAAAASKPPERLSRQAESTRVQLSTLGQVKSATAQVEATAARLQDNKNLGTAADAAKAVQAFADAANSRLETARQVSQPAGAERTANELRRAAYGAGGNESLQQIGVSFARDGRIQVDAKALEKAFQANPVKARETLNQLGEAAAQVSARQLSDDGTVGGSINRLTEKLGDIEQKQADYRAQLAQSRKAVQEQDRRADLAQELAAQQDFAFNGVGAYKRILNV